MGMQWSPKLAYDEFCELRIEHEPTWSDKPLWGLFPGSVVMTDKGPKMVERLAEGDLLETFEQGLRPVQGLLIRAPMRVRSDADLPFFVPEGVLGNEFPVVLPPHAKVVMESDKLEETTGDPFVTVPVASLNNLAGIHRTTLRLGSVSIAIELEEPSLINVGCGAYAAICTGMGTHDGAIIEAEARPANGQATNLASLFGLDRLH
jgi:hypothetical protein